MAGHRLEHFEAASRTIRYRLLKKRRKDNKREDQISTMCEGIEAAEQEEIYGNKNTESTELAP